jgi:hypothetical protein
VDSSSNNQEESGAEEELEGSCVCKLARAHNHHSHYAASYGSFDAT